MSVNVYMLSLIKAVFVLLIHSTTFINNKKRTEKGSDQTVLCTLFDLVSFCHMTNSSILYKFIFFL